ncbi:hypothetical protein PR202_gb23598 [Eleusine coracana subsp. coracana]|uniref:Uncharacterized protein n=1 Tax=Eleusine coracana subsp. coracana TaxID=191504 RepID=A0AAV5FJ21_ELECO|nr:hypothetical protein PR202_gb23598 [Eleusine coracana subsp. coracana]
MRGEPGASPIPDDPWTREVEGDLAESSEQGANRRFEIGDPQKSLSHLSNCPLQRCATPGNIVTIALVEAEIQEQGKRAQADKGEEQIEEFFGQLWAIPLSPPRVRVPAAIASTLGWVRKDLVRNLTFSPADFHPARTSDKWRGEVKQINLATRAKQKRELGSYAEAVKRSRMAEQGGARGFQKKQFQHQ